MQVPATTNNSKGISGTPAAYAATATMPTNIVPTNLNLLDIDFQAAEYRLSRPQTMTSSCCR